MTLAPQKAKARKKQSARKNTKREAKRERRIAPEFTLVWSPEATEAVNGRSSDFVKDVFANAYARIYKAEAALCGVIEIAVTLGRVGPIQIYRNWWAPFRVEDLWFKLRYHDKLIREYELIPVSGPSPDDSGDAEDGGDPPVVTRRQKGPPPTRIAPPPRPRKSDDPKSSLPSPARKNAKPTGAKRALTILYRFIRRGLNAGAIDLDHRLSQLKHRFKPRLLRSLVRVRRSSGIFLHSVRDAARPFVQTAQEFVAFAMRLRTSFTDAREFPVQTVSRGATLVPRCAGQNIGLNIRFYSWSWDEIQPVDWSQYLFGVDWTVNLFGVLPEEERAFR